MRKARMTALRRLAGGGAAVLALVAASAAPAAADPTTGPPICNGTETPISGVYHGTLYITGNRAVLSDTSLTVHGSIVVTRGACLDAFSMGTVTVSGNIYVGNHAILALGCTLGSVPPPTPCTGTTDDTVGVSIIAHRPQTLDLDGDTIDGNLVSTGGGPGPTADPSVNFAVKDNWIGGNVLLSGWRGGWIGYIRNQSLGNVTITRNVGLVVGEYGLDSTEVVSNYVRGNLVCLHNYPHAQVGDSHGGPNVVLGRAVGECAGLVVGP